MKDMVINLEVNPIGALLSLARGPGSDEISTWEKWPRFISLSQRQSIACNQSIHRPMWFSVRQCV